MDDRAVISPEVLARYAADAAREVEGVRRIADSHLRRQRGVKVEATDRGVELEIRVIVDYGHPVSVLGRELQRRVRQYLKVMADVDPVRIEVVVAGVEPSPA
jgi:uncharacterized alkaline shock family protein YloU